MMRALPRYSLARLFLFVALISLLFASWAQTRHFYAKQWAALELINGNNSEIACEQDSTEPIVFHFGTNRQARCFVKSNPSRWLRLLFADDEIRRITLIELRNPNEVRRFLQMRHSFPFLEQLSLGSDDFTDSEFSLIAELKSLKALEVFSDAINGTGITKLASLPRLRSIGLHSPGLTIDGVNCLSALPALSSLRLTAGSNIRFGDLSVLKHCSRIGWITLHGNCDDRTLQTIGQMPELDMVSISSSDREMITDQGIEYLLESRTIHAADIRGKITDRAIPAIVHCKNLAELTVWGGELTDEGEAELRAARPDLTFTLERLR